MAKMGRPPKPASERASRQIAIRLTPAEYERLEQSAVNASKKRGLGLSVTEYVRERLGFTRGEQ